LSLSHGALDLAIYKKSETKVMYLELSQYTLTSKKNKKTQNFDDLLIIVKR